MSKYRIKRIHQDSFDEWDVFLSATNEPSPFMSSKWLKAYSEVTGESFEILGCYNNNDELMAGFGYYYRRKFGKFKLVVNLLGVDNYIVFKQREGNNKSKKESYLFEIYNEFIKYFDLEFDHVEFTFNCANQDIRPFQWKGFNEKVKYTYRGELESPEQIIKNFNPDIRNKIKKAQKLNYRYDCSNNPKEVSISYDLIERSLKKNNQAHVFEKDAFLKICERLNENGLILVCNIYLDENPVATRVIVLNDKIAVDFQAGGNEVLFNTGLNQLLSLKIFETLYAKGVKLFDFRGANTPTVAKYKSGFNFRAEPYYLIQKNKGFVFRSMLKLKDLIS